MVLNVNISNFVITFKPNRLEKEYNFDEFVKSTLEDWKGKAEEDSKGKYPLSKLNWEVDQDILLSPFHAKVNNDSISRSPMFNPGLGSVDNGGWLNFQSFCANSNDFKKTWPEALYNGADGITIRNLDHTNLDGQLSGILPEHCHLNFESSESNVALIQSYVDWIGVNKFDVARVKGLYFSEALTVDVISGEQSVALDGVLNVLKSTHGLPGFKTIMVDGTALHNAGAGFVTQIGGILALLNQRMSDLLDMGADVHDIAHKLFVSLSIGSTFFNEMAKIRAIRFLIGRLLNLYGVKSEDNRIHMHAENSLRTMSKIDPKSNLLRLSSQAVSAVLSGIDSIALKPYDNSNEAKRITRNISNVLREESYLDKVIDPSKGSYYIENLTLELAEKGWEEFQRIEKLGGMSKVMAAGNYLEKIESENARDNEQLQAGGEFLIGVNNFGNTLEKSMVQSWPELDEHQFSEKRLSTSFEKVRKCVEAYATSHGAPKVIPIMTGANKAMRSARVTFTLNFFSWAGFQLVKELELSDLSEESGPVAYVFCGADDDYDTIEVSQVMDLLSADDRHLVVFAGKIPTGLLDHVGAQTERIKCIHKKANRLTVIEEIVKLQKLNEV